MSVAVTDRVVLAFVVRLLIVSFAATIEVAVAGAMTTSLVAPGTVCGLQFFLSLKLLLEPPVQVTLAMEPSS